MGRAPDFRFDATPGPWTRADCLTDLWSTRVRGSDAVSAAARKRFEVLVDRTRRGSRFYAEAWRELHLEGWSHRVPALAEFPVVTRTALMARFDDWVTDPDIHFDDVSAFASEPSNIGEPWRDRYYVWKSSGTRGEPGLFVNDASALDVYDALVAAQLITPGLAASYARGLLTAGGRAALITADTDHYASIVNWRHALRESPWAPACALSVADPMPDLVKALNVFQPALVASYPTVLAALALEQREGRLAMSPSTVWTGGERLTASMKREIEEAFGATVQCEYGASEALSIAYGCTHGWLHVNADWVIVEPVDRHGHPTPPGQLSESVLITNLCNFVQPIVRYELGDRVLVKPEPCECGNPLPAIHVEGRTDDILKLALADGRTALIPPQAIATAIEEAAGIHRFQIVQVAADRLRVRLSETGLARKLAWSRLFLAIQGFLSERNLLGVEVTLDDGAPLAAPGSGKLDVVVRRRAK